jgi:predicted nucleic acid-binding protein
MVIGYVCRRRTVEVRCSEPGCSRKTRTGAGEINALVWKRDARHPQARAAWKRLLQRGATLVTTDLVLAESVSLARGRGGYELSVGLGERLLAPPFEIVWTTRSLVDAAWSLYRKYEDQELSLCGCVSFAVMRARHITTAFAYDSDFETAGFERAR